MQKTLKTVQKLTETLEGIQDWARHGDCFILDFDSFQQHLVLTNLTTHKDPKVVLIEYGLLGLNGWSTVSPTAHVIVRTRFNNWTDLFTYHGVHYFGFTARWKLLLLTWKGKTAENQMNMVLCNACFCPPLKWMEAMIWYYHRKHCCQDSHMLQRDERFWSNISDDNNNSPKNNSLLLSIYNVPVTLLGSLHTYLIFITTCVSWVLSSPILLRPRGAN